MNIGSNYEVSIGDAAALIAERMGRDIAVVSDDRRMRPSASEVERLWAANEKAARLTGWTPQYAGRDGFGRGLDRTIAWFTDPDHLRRYKPGQYNI